MKNTNLLYLMAKLGTLKESRLVYEDSEPKPSTVEQFMKKAEEGKVKLVDVQQLSEEDQARALEEIQKLPEAKRLKALAEIQKAGVTARAEERLTHVKKETEAEKKKREEAEAKAADERRTAMEDIGKAMSHLGELDLWTISTVRRRSKKIIRPDQWDPKDDLERIKRDWGNLQIASNSPFYVTLWEELAKCKDKAYYEATGLSAKEQMIYRDPLSASDEVLKDFGDKAFANAVTFFKAVKEVVVRQTKAQEAAEKGKREFNQDTLAAKGVNFVSENVKALKDALSSSPPDYATAAVYIGGAYALYKLWSKWGSDEHSGGEHGKEKGLFTKDNIKTGFWLALAVYGVNKFSGIGTGKDLAERFGITDAQMELKGTPMEALYKMPNQEINGYMKNVPHSVVSRLTFTNLKSLHTIYSGRKPPVSEPFFVDPAQFAEFSEEFSGLLPSDIDEKTQAGEPLTPKLEAYRKTGVAIYYLVESLKKSYEVTNMEEREKKTFAEALEGETLSQSTVFDYCTQLADYVSNYSEQKIGTGTAEKLRTRLEEAIGTRELEFRIDTEQTQGGVLTGMFMDYPVAFRLAGGIEVFEQKAVENAGGNPKGLTALAIIPMEGDPSVAVTTLQDRITTKVRDEFKVFAGSNYGTMYTEPMYDLDKGYWTTTIDAGGAPWDPLATTKMEAYIRAGRSGGGLAITTPAGQPLAYMRGIDSPQTLKKDQTLSFLTMQAGIVGTRPDLRVLQYFYKQGKLDVMDDAVAGDEYFMLRILGVGDFRIKADVTAATPTTAGSASYTFDPATGEAELLKNPNFRTKLGELIRDEKALFGETFESVRQEMNTVLENAPEGFIDHLFKRMPEWYKKFTWAAPLRGVSWMDFQGSIPEQLTKYLWETQIQFQTAKVTYGIQSMTDLASVYNKVSLIVPSAQKSLADIKDSFTQATADYEANGRDWNKVDFDAEVINKLLTVGVDSPTFQSIHNRGILFILNYPGFSPEQKRDLIKLWNDNTAMCDDPNMDGADLNNTSDPKTIAYMRNVTHADDVLVKIKAWMVTHPGQEVEWFKVPYPPARIKTKLEMFDMRPPLKWEHDYTDFEQFNGNTPVGSPLPPITDVILPRKDVTLQVKTKDFDDKLFQPMVDEINKEMAHINTGTSVLTPFELALRTRLYAALDYVEKNCGNPKPGAFDGLKLEYRVPVKLHDKAAGTPIPGVSVPGRWVQLEITELGKYAHRIEENLHGTTVTKSDQETEINKAVETIIRTRIFNESDPTLYEKFFFKDPSYMVRFGRFLSALWNKVF